MDNAMLLAAFVLGIWLIAALLWQGLRLVEWISRSSSAMMAMAVMVVLAFVAVAAWRLLFMRRL
jgi:hypothetical protein